MPLIPLRILLDHAAENNYGVAALNVNNMEQIQAIMEAARETDSPVIVLAKTLPSPLTPGRVWRIRVWPGAKVAMTFRSLKRTESRLASKRNRPSPPTQR